MNANTSRPHPDGPDEHARWLLSGTARDLPTGRHELHKERLMAQIHEQQQDERTTPSPAPRRRLRLPRPSIALPLVAATVAGAVVLGLVQNDGGGAREGGVAVGPVLTTPIGAGSSKGVPQLLDRISAAAGEKSHPTVEDGQFVYIESKVSDIFPQSIDGKISVGSYALHRRQVWNSGDGTEGWLIDPAVNDSPEGQTLGLPDEKGNTPEANLNAPSHEYLSELTTDPDELLAKIYAETKGMGNSPDQQAFATIGDLLGESYPPAELSVALFKTAAKIPGVVVVDEAVDAAGRKGVAVARLDEVGGSREEWIFDRKTHAYLGSRTVQVRPGTGEDAVLKPGMVLHTSAIMTRAVVDGMREVPAG
ncbi:CU044_5270 family protein [Streptomyces sp. NPDC002490]|uniref:CU044_5270 family protein n=1 Tax=Streptomyces sp. NPDC002490 TaxID=3154416 RepID=UPI003332A7A4